jgi:hypothetical protein
MVPDQMGRSDDPTNFQSFTNTLQSLHTFLTNQWYFAALMMRSLHRHPSCASSSGPAPRMAGVAAGL